MITRPLTFDNLIKVAALEQLCFGANAWSVATLQAEIGCQNKHYFVIEDNLEILAYGGFAHILDEAHIMNIAVNPLHRHKGIGTFVLNSMIQKAQSLGIKSITLEVRESNIAARSLYEKAGFVLAGIRKGYYQDHENACIYWKHDL